MLQRVHACPAAARRLAQPGGEPALLVGQRVDVEHPGDALPALDLAEQDVLAVGGERERERGGDRRLAGAALAGHHVQAHARPVAGGFRHGREPRDGTTVPSWALGHAWSAAIARSPSWTDFLRAGLPGGLVLTGEPGVGKSALWEYAAGLAAELVPSSCGRHRVRARSGTRSACCTTCSATSTSTHHQLRGPVREALAAVLLRGGRHQPGRRTAGRGRRPRRAGRPRRGPPGGGARRRRPLGRLRFAPGPDLRRPAPGPGAGPVPAHPTRRLRPHQPRDRRSPAGTCARSSPGHSASRRPRGCSATTWTSR